MQLNYSEWSDVYSFITKPIYIASGEEAKLYGPVKEKEGLFASAVAIDRTGSRVIIGAHGLSEDGKHQVGKAYVFTRNSSNWVLEATLKPNVATEHTWFGHSVSIDATGSKIAIGGYGANSSKTDMSGSVYIFSKTDSAWIHETTLTASDAHSGDAFGFSVALNAKGDHLVVGAYLAEPCGIPASGKIYVYRYINNTWDLDNIIYNPNKGTGDNFGWSVAISDDGDRIASAACCADYEGDISVGKVHVFHKRKNAWEREAALVASDRAPGDHFGWSISMDSDCHALVITSPFSRSGRMLRTGKAYIFTRSGPSWSEETIIHANDESANSQFGISVAINTYGDRIVIGAPQASSDFIQEVGKVYVFIKSKGEWQQRTCLVAKDKEPNNLFGSSIALDGTGKRMIIGAPLTTIDGKPAVGKAYIYA